jgi:hypothetical protein
VKRPLRLGREAEAEIEAWRWYEGAKAGRGGEFLTAIEEALLRLEGPAVGLSIARVPVRLGVRRILVRRFP